MNKIFTISIGNDHAGFDLKFEIKKFLEEKKINVLNKGCDGPDSVDYPDYGHAVAEDIINKEAEKGIVICGSGNGINMSVNKHKGIRSALCWNSELAVLGVTHNNANILALPARFISKKEALKCVMAFITNEFEGGRHEKRVNKINC
jgi:ribose 5-phosphate isomerase B